MKAGIIFSGSSPLLVLTSYQSFRDEKFADKLRAKGVMKYIAFDVPLDMAKEKYGLHFDIILGDLRQSDDLRVLDYNGHNIMGMFSFKDMGTPLFYE